MIFRCQYNPPCVDVRWVVLVVAECLPGSWLVHPADFIRAARQPSKGVFAYPRITQTLSPSLSLRALFRDQSRSLRTCRFLTLDDMF
jgi:hypothetical protein